MTQPFFDLQSGQSLHMYLHRGDGIHVVQGRVELLSRRWLAEQYVALALPLQTESCYQPDAAGWVQLRALPGEAVQLQRLAMNAQSLSAKIRNQLLQLLGFLSFMSIRLKVPS